MLLGCSALQDLRLTRQTGDPSSEGFETFRDSVSERMRGKGCCGSTRLFQTVF
jgi:hypothetical protein